MRRTELGAALLLLVLALGAVLLAGARSAAGRMLDLAEYRARSPYYQAAALRAQMAGDDGSGNAWIFVILAVLVLIVVALVALRPTLRELRLMRRRSGCSVANAAGLFFVCRRLRRPVLRRHVPA